MRKPPASGAGREANRPGSTGSGQGRSSGRRGPGTGGRPAFDDENARDDDARNAGGRGGSGSGYAGGQRRGGPRTDGPRAGGGAGRGGNGQGGRGSQDARREAGNDSRHTGSQGRDGGSQNFGGDRRGKPTTSSRGSRASGTGRSDEPRRDGTRSNSRDGRPARSGPGARNPRGAAGKPTRSTQSRSGGPKNQQPRGPKPFAGERFGQNVAPAKRAQPKKRGSAKRPPTGPLAAPEKLYDRDGERLQKIMANAGVASRRVCEEMIEAGRVEVDGQIVRELGFKVDPQRSTIHVDGIRIQVDDTLRYMVFNKPAGVVSTMDDPEGRPAVADFLKDTPERLFHVGRLDVETEGLLLLTNDGELANRLTHPSYEVPKTYLVQVRGPMPKGVGQQLKSGVELDDGLASVDSFSLIDSTPGHVLVEVVLHSGKNRIVRRMFKAVGFPVQRLVRVKVGPIALGDQKQGSVRVLGKQESGVLLASVGL